VIGAGAGVRGRGVGVRRSASRRRQSQNRQILQTGTLYTSLSLCLLRATCASDVAMICIEVWHKKQNNSVPQWMDGGREKEAEMPLRGSWITGWGMGDVGQSYMSPVFMTHMRAAGRGQCGETFTYICILYSICEYHNKQENKYCP